ncbi:MAG TPA: hypothetical protein VKC61_17535 [Pyrinomonadaceae bacterium]|nr:hypothetical protein [Pyrinomonadaceae bacterium]
MGNINMGRVILGGLVAGLVLNIGEYLLNGVVLAAQMKSFMTQHNFTEPPYFIPIAVILTFVLGIVIVLGYACIRPRFGPGVKTAIIAGLFAWFGVCFYCTVINGVLAGIPMGTMILGMVWCLVEYCLGAIAGAWVYQEA